MPTFDKATTQVTTNLTTSIINLLDGVEIANAIIALQNVLAMASQQQLNAQREARLAANAPKP